jgi:hypothetical protein
MTMDDVKDVPTPECDKRSKIMHTAREPHLLLTEFWDWLSGKQYVLAQWTEPDPDDIRDQELVPLYTSPEQVFADFFGLDLQKIEAEQRAILDAIRKPSKEDES